MASGFLHLASEVIVVDSSTDDTLDVCRNILPAHTKIIEHPPGLYASWNAAIQTVESEYIYVSTVGDSIEFEFLGQMLAFCGERSLDVLITPPRIIGAKKECLWPIHRIVSKYQLSKPVVLESYDAALLNYYSLVNYGLSSLSGSFASNLFRAKVAQQQPFPTNYGGFGDTMWFAAMCGEMRLGIIPNGDSTFFMHASAHQKFTNKELHHCWQEARRSQLVAVNSTTKLFLSALNAKVEQYHACKMNLKTLRSNQRRGVLSFFEILVQSTRKKFLRYSVNVQIRPLEQLVAQAFLKRNGEFNVGSVTVA